MRIQWRLGTTPWSTVLVKLIVPQLANNFFRILWNPTFHYCPVFSQMNPIHTPPACCFTLNFIMILSGTFRVFKLLFFFKFCIYVGWSKSTCCVQGGCLKISQNFTTALLKARSCSAYASAWSKAFLHLQTRAHIPAQKVALRHLQPLAHGDLQFHSASCQWYITTMNTAISVCSCMVVFVVIKCCFVIRDTAGRVSWKKASCQALLVKDKTQWSGDRSQDCSVVAAVLSVQNLWWPVWCVWSSAATECQHFTKKERCMSRARRTTAKKVALLRIDVSADRLWAKIHLVPVY